MLANYSTDEKNFTDHMFNKKLQEKSYDMSLKALPVKIHRSKNRKGWALCPEADRVKISKINIGRQNRNSFHRACLHTVTIHCIISNFIVF